MIHSVWPIVIFNQLKRSERPINVPVWLGYVKSDIFHCFCGYRYS